MARPKVKMPISANIAPFSNLICFFEKSFFWTFWEIFQKFSKFLKIFPKFHINTLHIRIFLSNLNIFIKIFLFDIKYLFNSIELNKYFISNKNILIKIFKFDKNILMCRVFIWNLGKIFKNLENFWKISQKVQKNDFSKKHIKFEKGAIFAEIGIFTLGLAIFLAYFTFLF